LAFTTWAAEVTRLKNALASQSGETLLQKGYTDPKGKSVTFRSLDEVRYYLKFLEQKASEESSGGKRSRIASMGYRGRY